MRRVKKCVRPAVIQPTTVVDYNKEEPPSSPTPPSSPLTLKDFYDRFGSLVCALPYALGTPHYRAPECRPSAPSLAADGYASQHPPPPLVLASCSDVYSLGVTMLELLLGRTVHGEQQQEEAIQQLTAFTLAFGQGEEGGGKTAPAASHLQQAQWMMQQDAKAAVPTAVIQHIRRMLEWNAFERGNIQQMIHILEEEINGRSPAGRHPT